jgi:hypothetical protein
VPGGDGIPGPFARVRVPARDHAEPADLPLSAVGVAVQDLDGAALVAPVPPAVASEEMVAQSVTTRL